MQYRTPNEVYQELFTDLHQSGLWADGKIISDAIPNQKPGAILKAYREEKNQPGFDLKAFFDRHFTESKAGSSSFQSDTSRPVEEHIRVLWDELTRSADQAIEGASLIPLPYPYVVPGGRFNEIYYWDSYFTMLGLRTHGRLDLVQSMIDNFSWLIEQIGHIPNGNRTYFLGRSQPPFYALMIDLLAEEMGEGVWGKYLPYLEKEYVFWMKGREHLSESNAAQHIVRMPGGEIMNRYYDEVHSERMEMYADDRELADEAGREEARLFLDLRAACESGWDFSARWLDDESDLGTIRASDLAPVDLNCLLYFLERGLQKGSMIVGNAERASVYGQAAQARADAIQKYCWHEALGYFVDYDVARQEKRDFLSLAGMFPLFFRLASQEQAMLCKARIEDLFLRPGGLVTTLVQSGQQWDAPNGWAPLQWVAFIGLRNYGFENLALEVAQRWITLCTDVYQRTGKMLEKYNVEDTSLLSGGGEYPVQDGFGWSNGVLVAMKQATGS